MYVPSYTKSTAQFLWPDEHLKCKCSNYATTLVTLVAQQYVYNKYLCSLSPFMVSYPLPKSPPPPQWGRSTFEVAFLFFCFSFTRIWRDSFKTCNLLQTRLNNKNWNISWNSKYIWKFLCDFIKAVSPIAPLIKGLPNTTILQYTIAENHETRFVGTMD